MSELHLFIIWSNASDWKDAIIEDMKTRFSILGIHRVSWEKEHFSENLSRFYGENLPKNSNKEKLCGNGPFTLVVVRDENPLYRSRMTSKGAKPVNVNIFDSKEMYRNWTGGGHMVHGTNDIKEVRHDLVMLTGLSIEDYVKKCEKEQILSDDFEGMPGEKSWSSPEQVIYVLNETVNYVVLRNFSGLYAECERNVHGDVDILTEKSSDIKRILNAKRVHKSRFRVQHIVKIGDGGTFFDIRTVGDNYYCRKWEENILKNRYLHKDGYYRTDDDNFKYSLLYHALVHKKNISSDYMNIFQNEFPETAHTPDVVGQLIQKLVEYMAQNDYSFTEPKDYSVYFNKTITNQKMSVKKFCLKAYHKLLK